MRKKIFALLVACLAFGLFADDFAICNYPDTPGWIFRPGAEVEAAFRTEKEMSEAPVIEHRDYYGNVKQLNGRLVGGTQVRFELPTDRNGYFTLKCGKVTWRYAVIPELPPRDTSANPFGVNFHLDRITLSEGAREIAFARYIGFDWGRSMLIDWSELRSDDYDREYKKYAGLYRQAQESGMHVLGQILYIPRFASGRQDEEYLVWSRTPNESMEGVTKHAQYLAKTYPFITHWEIGNESDHESFWRGRKSSMGNRRKVIEDYVDFLAAAYAGFKAVSPLNQVVFVGTTSQCHRSFFDYAMAHKGRDYCDIMNVHYSRNIPEIREIIKENGMKDAPFWVTEIGSTAGGPVYDELRQLRADLLMCAEQFADGAVKVFKYNLRNDGCLPTETEHNYGMLTKDFLPKPNCVANATMIRMLQNARNCRRINITRNSSAGYLKGFEFDDVKTGRKVNFLILEGCQKTKVILDTQEKELLLTDAMGTERRVETVNGKAEFELTELPVFITGTITPKPGEVIYPKTELVRTIKGKFSNPSFAHDIKQWYTGTDKVSYHQEDGNGFMRVEIAPPGERTFHGVNTTMHNDVKAITDTLKEDEYLKIRAKARLRYKDLDNRGVAITAELLKPGANQRFDWREMPFENGSSDWKTFEIYSEIPKLTGKIRFSVMFAPRTSGVIDIDDISLELEVWHKPR